MKNKGHLIVLEGPDGVGKTTLSQALADAYNSDGIPTLYYAFPGREPGTLGHLVYRLHHRDPALNVQSLSSVSLQIAHVAAHVDAIERVILPALTEGKRVILDRFWWSTWVYGCADGILPALLDAIIGVEKEYWGGIVPTIAFLIARENPLRVETSAERWATLSRLYATCADREAASYPVQTILNERRVDDTLSLLCKEVENAIAAQTRSAVRDGS